MPTGYTADVKDGKVTTFPEFAMGCARAFGALIEMREEPKDAEIPEAFEPSNYAQQALGQAKQRLREVSSWSDDDAEAAADGLTPEFREADGGSEIVCDDCYREMTAWQTTAAYVAGRLGR